MTSKMILPGMAAVLLVLAAVLLVLAAVGCSPRSGMSGEEIFVQHCAGCHPDGGNTFNPRKTLHKKDLEANNIKGPGDIVGRMRNPGLGMPRFSRDVITDADAKKVAEYILSKF